MAGHFFEPWGTHVKQYSRVHALYICISIAVLTEGGKEGGANWESSTAVYTPWRVKEAAAGSCRTAQGAQPGALRWPRGVGFGSVGRSFQREGTYLYLWSIHFVVQHKLMQECKAIMSFLSSSVVKNPPANAQDARIKGSIPGSGRSPGGGNGNSLQYPCLGNPMDRGVWQATVHRVTKSRTWLRDWAHTQSNYIPTTTTKRILALLISEFKKLVLMLESEEYPRGTKAGAGVYVRGCTQGRLTF